MRLFGSHDLDSVSRGIFVAGLLCFALELCLGDLARGLSELHPALYDGLKALLLFWSLNLFFWILFRKGGSGPRAIGMGFARLLSRASLCLLIGVLLASAALGWQHVFAPFLHLPDTQQGFCHGPCASLLSHLGF